MRLITLLIVLCISSCAFKDSRLHGYSNTGYLPEGASEFIILSRPEDFSPIVDRIYQLVLERYDEHVVDITFSSIGEIKAFTCPAGPVGKIYDISKNQDILEVKITQKIWGPC